MEINGEHGELAVIMYAEEPYWLRVGVYVGREDEEDGGGVYRQVIIDTSDPDEAVELMLSIPEAEHLRDLLTTGIRLAAQAPDPAPTP